MAGHVAEVVAAVREAFRDRPVRVMRGRTGAQRVARRVVVLLVGLEHSADLAVRRSDRA